MSQYSSVSAGRTGQPSAGRLFAVCLALSSCLALPNSVRAQDAQQLEAPSEAKLLYGVLETPARHFRFALLSEDGELTELQSFDEGNAKFKLEDVSRTEEELKFSLPSTDAVYSATRSVVDADGSVGQAYEGFWVQRGAKLPLSFTPQNEAPESAEAVWEGTMSILFQKLEVRVRQNADGRVYFDSLSQRVGGFVAELDIEDDKVTMEVPALKGSFAGKLSESGEEMSGTWKQGVYSADLVLKKLDNVESTSSGPKRPQMPKPPYPYQVTEVTFAGGEPGVTLAGTITMPKSPEGKLVPGVVLVSGSGPQNRDEELADHKPFLVLADYLTRQGIAVLRYDDRGVADSTGDFASATTTELGADAEAAFDFLSKTSGVNVEAVGICGHSEGGIIAPLVAARNNNVAFIVMLASPGVNGGELAKSQTRLLLEASGAPAATVENSVKVQKALVELAMKDPPLSESEYIEQAKAQVIDFLPSTEEKKQVDAIVKSAYQQLSGTWFANSMRSDPTTNLENVSCAVLVLNGEKDLQVDPDLNLPPIEQALQKAPTEDFRIVRLPQLNHLFQQCQTGLPAEYGQIEQTMSEPVLELIVSWINERFK